jgi:hypothetical protein
MRWSLARESVPLNIIQRQLGHANLGTTSIYLQGIDREEIIAAAAPDAPRCPPAPGCNSDRPHRHAGVPRPSRVARARAGVCA